MSKVKFRLQKVLEIICDIEFIMDNNSLKITQAIEDRVLFHQNIELLLLRYL